MPKVHCSIESCQYNTKKYIPKTLTSPIGDYGRCIKIQVRITQAGCNSYQKRRYLDA